MIIRSFDHSIIRSKSILLPILFLAAPLSAMEPEEFKTLAKQCAPSVHSDTLAALVKTESSFHPLAININGSEQLPKQPENKAEAISTARYLSDNNYNFDAGLGQINHKNIAAFGMTWEQVFEPCANLNVAAYILSDCFVRASSDETNPQLALRNALSCYNSGNFITGHDNGYVQRVEQAANRLTEPIVPALLPINNTAEHHAIQNLDPSLFNTIETDAFGHNARVDAFDLSQPRTEAIRLQRSVFNE